MMAKSPKLLVELFPELAAELEQLLLQQGESELARQVSKLPVIDRCRCEDDFCGMFYVLPKPKGACGPGHRNVSLEPKQGMLILDVVAERIAAGRGSVLGCHSAKPYRRVSLILDFMFGRFRAVSPAIRKFRDHLRLFSRTSSLSGLVSIRSCFAP
jgi:hypothetical protein